MSSNIYATPKIVTDLAQCYFYHTMDVPGYGTVQGEWDLRGHVQEYLGGVDFRGKCVLEVGTADGFLCFQMENQGAQVVAYDLSENSDWDIVPYAGYDYQLYALEKKRQIVQLNNAFWLCHRAFRSNANVVHGAAYDIPEGIGLVDISTFGAVLLHIRDPFRALQKALRLTREAVIVTEPLWQRPLPQRILARLVSRRFLGSDIVFVPDFRRREPKDAWWVLSPDTIRRFIGVLGFENTKVIYHSQSFRTLGNQARIPCYTVVGYRTIDALA